MIKKEVIGVVKFGGGGMGGFKWEVLVVGGIGGEGDVVVVEGDEGV